MLTAWVLLMLNSLFFTLRLSGGGSGGSFPRPLKAEEERAYLDRFAKGDMDARNKLIEHNLRLVAHIIKRDTAERELFPGGTQRICEADLLCAPDQGHQRDQGLF